MDSKKLALRSLLIIVIVAGLFSVVMIFILPEDYWYCQNNQWLKHGNPSQPMPQNRCGNIKSADPTADWQIYQNQKYGFELKHPLSWNVETYEYNKGSSLNIAEFLLAQPTVDYGNNPNRPVFWSINIWKPSVTTDQIANSVGFDKYDVKDFTSPTSSLIESNQMSNVSGKAEKFRLFLIQGSKYTYSLTSQTCSDESSVECAGLLTSFKLLEQ